MKPAISLLRSLPVGLVAVFVTTSSLAAPLPYVVTDTGQSECYGVSGGRIAPPAPGAPLHGQDAQYWSATEYLGTTMNGDATVFGVNFADGRIKDYPRDRTPRGTNRQFVRYVRGNPAYGLNDFVDNGDGTVTDRATGLMWQKGDSGRGMN